MQTRISEEHPVQPLTSLALLTTLLLSGCASTQSTPPPSVTPAPQPPQTPATVSQCDESYTQMALATGKDVLIPSCFDNADSLLSWAFYCALDMVPVTRVLKAARFGAQVASSAYEQFSDPCREHQQTGPEPEQS